MLPGHDRVRQRRRGRPARHGRSPRPPATRTEGELAGVIEAVVPSLAGAFSFVLMDATHLYGVRDPHGFRPLCLGRLGPGAAPRGLGARLGVAGPRRHRRDLRPRARARRDGDDRARRVCARRQLFADDEVADRLCIFEFVYFARPDTRLHGQEVHGARRRMGELLARQAPVEADMVMGVPDSGVPAAEGYAREANIPYGQGLVKNRYIGRTFIDPDQQARVNAVRRKLNPLRENIEGKRLIVVDDSIVRGTTTRCDRRHAPRGRRDRGAPAHLVAAVPVAVLLRHRHPDPRRAAGRQQDAWPRSQRYLDVDSIAYITLENLKEAIGADGSAFCDACLTGHYPVPVPVTLIAGARPRPIGPPTDRRRPPPGRAARGLTPWVARPSDGRPGATYAGAGVDLGAADAVVDRIGRTSWRATARPEVLGLDRRVRRALRPRHRPLPAPGARLVDRRGRDQAAGGPGRSAATTPSGSTSSPCASTTSSASAPSRCSSSTTWRSAASTPTAWSRWSRGSRPGCRAGRLRADRRGDGRASRGDGRRRPRPGRVRGRGGRAGRGARRGPGPTRRRPGRAALARAAVQRLQPGPPRPASSGPAARSTARPGPAPTRSLGDELLEPSVIYAPAVAGERALGRRWRPRRGARDRRRDRRQPRPACCPPAATRWSSAARGRSRGSSPRSPGRRDRRTTRWRGCSTSGSAWCWSSIPAASEAVVAAAASEEVSARSPSARWSPGPGTVVER